MRNASTAASDSLCCASRLLERGSGGIAILDQAGQFGLEVVRLGPGLRHIATQIRQHGLKFGPFLRETLRFGQQLVAFLGGGGDDAGKFGLLLFRLSEFLDAILEPGGLLREFGHTGLGDGDFLLPLRHAVLQILMIRLRSGQFLLRAGMRRRERGDDHLQAADFFCQRE
jgi:hypothetical protein